MTQEFRMPRAIGWLVVCFPDRENPDWCEPLSFGRPDEPSPEMLLRRRRFMAFENHGEAEAALRQTKKTATELGYEWASQFRFGITPVEMHVPEGKPF